MLSNYSAAQLVPVFNRYAARPTRKFTDASIARARTEAAIRSAGKTVEQALIEAGLIEAPPVAVIGPEPKFAAVYAPTPKQAAVIRLATRKQGVTLAEILAETGWVSVAARVYCQGLADRFGYKMTVTGTPSHYCMTAR